MITMFARMVIYPMMRNPLRPRNSEKEKKKQKLIYSS